MRGVLSRGELLVLRDGMVLEVDTSLPVQGLSCSILLLMDVRPRID